MSTAVAWGDTDETIATAPEVQAMMASQPSGDDWGAADETVSGDEIIALSDPKKVQAYTQAAKNFAPDLGGIGEHAAASQIPESDRLLFREILRKQYAANPAMKEAGYGKRLAASAFQGAVDLSMPLLKMTGAVPSLDPEQERFKQELLGVREGLDPTIRPDTPTPGRWLQQAARMSAPMIMSVGAGKLAGGTAMAAGASASLAKWATAAGTSGSFLPQIADQTYTQLIGEGVQPDQAWKITAVSAPIVAAIESILPDPLSPYASAFKGTARQIAGKILWQATKNYTKELSEEGLQGVVNETAMEVGRRMEEQVPDKGLGNILLEGVASMWESAGPLLIMMGPGAAIGAVQTAQGSAERKARLEQLKEIRSAEAKEIKRRAAEVGITGSRSEVRKQLDSEIEQLQKDPSEAEVPAGRPEARPEAVPAPEVPVAEAAEAPDVASEPAPQAPTQPQTASEAQEAPKPAQDTTRGLEGFRLHGTSQSNGVRTELYQYTNGKKGGAVRTVDVDSGEVIGIKRFPSFAAASQEYARTKTGADTRKQPEEAFEPRKVSESVPPSGTLPEAAQEPEQPKKRTGRKGQAGQPASTPKRGRKPKPPSDPQTLIQAVQQLGGISAKSIRRDLNIQGDIKEFGLLGIFKNTLTKGYAGHDLETMAIELESAGYWLAPEGANKGDALLQALKAKAKTIQGMEKEVEREYAEYQAKREQEYAEHQSQLEQELRNARERGEDEESQREAVRAGAQDGAIESLDEAGATEEERQAIIEEAVGEVDDSFNFGANATRSQAGVPGEQQGLFQKESQGALFNVVPPKGKAEKAVPQKSELEKIEDDLKAGHKESLPNQKTMRSVSGEFGRDVSGILGIADNVPISGQKGEAGRSVRHFFQRFFTSRGELPQEVYDAKVRKEGRVAKEMAHLRFAGGDFRRGIKTALGGKELTQADVEQMNAVLRGEADERTVPEQVRAPLRAMRDHIDALSRMLIAEGVAQGDLVGIITENMGLYTTRSYRVFDDPQWRNNVPAAVRNRAISAIRQMDPSKSDAEVQGLLESLLFRGAADSPMALLKGSKLGSKDLSTFMKRKDIPEWLRDLWGEYKDAGVNYARSVFKMSHLLANQQFLNRVREAGSGKWLRTPEDGPVVNEHGEVITPIAAEGSSVMEPLNGMYTTPEIKAAFERFDSPGAMPEYLRVLMSVTNTVKYSKTVLSMMTHIRNLISNTGFAVANGHWHLDKSGKALWGTATGMFKLPDAEFRAYYERAAELGLIGEDVRAGELKQALRDASRADIDEFLYNAQARQAKKIVRVGRGGVRLLNSLYQAEDGVWKLYAWENEKARYAKAHPDWSQDQVEQRAADIVRDTYPTYSKIPKAVRELGRFPLVGPFVSFPSEVVRTTFHTIKLGLKEMQTPETRAFGAQRLAGTVVALGGLSVLSRGMMALFGIGDDEDDDLRWFVPPWQENSRFIYTARPDNGIYKFVDLGYSDPHAYLTDAAIAFMRGDDWKDSLTKAMTEFLRPFMSEEILAKTLMDVRSNEDQKIYNPKDTAGEQAKDIVGYVLQKAFVPGTVTSLLRINTAIEGTDPNLEVKTEVLAMTTGQRLQKVDVGHSLGFRVREFAKALTDIQNIARKTVTSRGTATGEMVAADRARMEALRLAEFAQMQRIAGAARRLGVPEENIRALLTGELTDQVAEQVMSGDYAPYEMTPQTVKQMLEANPAEFKERFSAWHGDKLPEAIFELRRKRNTAALRKLYED